MNDNLKNMTEETARLRLYGGVLSIIGFIITALALTFEPSNPAFIAIISMFLLSGLTMIVYSWILEFRVERLKSP